MPDNQEVTVLSEEAFMPFLFERSHLLMTFATAVVRAHPNPAALLAAFRKTLDEDEEGALPFEELTPANQEAHRNYEISRDMLLRVLAGRVDRQ